MKELGNDPTEDRTAWYYKPCGTRSSRGLLDRGPSRHEMPTWERVRKKTPSSTRREGSAREKVKIQEEEGRETRVKSGGIDIKTETPDIGESSPGGAKSVKGAFAFHQHH